MNESIIKEDITGARNFRTISVMIVLFLAGLGFFLAGLSSYFNTNLLLVTDTSGIVFIPQGIALLFYGTGALGIAIYVFLTLFWNVGSGYNEFSKKENIVRIGLIALWDQLKIVTPLVWPTRTSAHSGELAS